jgi:hypothetical protein
MNLFENFANKPVMILLKESILSAISAEEVDLGEDGKCGSATMAFMQGKEPGSQPQPAMIQVIRGSLEDSNETHVIISTTGADNKTGLHILVELSNIRSVCFAIEHFDQAPAPQIVLP